MKRVLVLLILIAVFVSFGTAFTQDASKFQYIGVQKCKMCHKGEKKGNIFEKWEQDSHSKAYAELASDKAKEVAKKAGVEGDPQKAAACLSCHITGYDAPASAKTETLTLEEGVSCEACHGAGSEYKSLKVMKAITAGTQKGEEVGLVKPTKELCVSCHNTKSPTYKEFVFEEAVKKIAHPLPK